jgi:7-cyano-7-deazaguanine tRNA-ribosyltransferase
MRAVFEVREWDGAGRLGELDVPRRGVTVETPALCPVINPHIRTVEPRTLAEEFGAEVLITNGYVLYTSDDFRERALSEGLHDLLEFPGAIVTDSGSFQLAEYGDVEIDTREIVEFQLAIGSDVVTPVDLPTPPDVGRERAEREVATTTERIELAAGIDRGDALLNVPVQGSTYPDLREHAAREAYGVGDVYPVGAMVPLMREYRFGDVVRAVRGAKHGLGADAPVHLFGAGHPMLFALAVAAGCDLFDSAAYALYARDDRYLTVRGTAHLEELDYLPCSCPVCIDRDAATLRDAGDEARERLLARHNLHVSYEELRRVKGALRAGNLLELVETRARGHPALVDGYRALLDDAGDLERTDPASKGAFFYLSPESARRPEVARHHDRLARLPVAGEEVLLTAGNNDESFDESWRLLPAFGPHPRALSKSYPLTAEIPDQPGPAAYEAAAEGVRRLVAANPGVDVTLRHDGWPERALAEVPDGVTIQRLGVRDD